MTLFNYGECDVCKTIKGSKEKVLMDIIPVDISCKVSNYICCWRCEKMKEREHKYYDKHIAINIGLNELYTKPEIQLHFFKYYKKTFLVEASTWCDGGKEFENEIDRIFDKPKAKEKYINNKMELQAIKSYCKNQRNKIQVMVWQCRNLKMFKNQFARSYPYNTYAFRNKEYLVNGLIKKFLVEYVDDLIGSDKQYCDMEEIREYIDKLFD